MKFITTCLNSRGVPRKVSAKMQKFFYDEFLRTGYSHHSRDGVTLAPLLTTLTDNKVPYQLNYVPGGPFPFTVRRIDKDEQHVSRPEPSRPTRRVVTFEEIDEALEKQRSE